MHRLFPLSRMGRFTLLAFLSGIIAVTLNGILALLQRPELYFLVSLTLAGLDIVFFLLTQVFKDIRYYVLEMSRRQLISWLSVIIGPLLLLLFYFWDVKNSLGYCIGLGVFILAVYFNFLAPYLIKRARYNTQKRAAQFAAHP